MGVSWLRPTICGAMTDYSNLLLKEVPKNISHNETQLNLGFNEITHIRRNAFVNLTLLTELRINHNRIVTIEAGAFHGLLSMTYLDLFRNQLSNIPELSRLVSLETLDISMNQIHWLDAHRIRKLNKLLHFRLSRCNVKAIPASLQMTSLRSIDLSYNEIKTLPESVFDGFDSLKILYLAGNKLSSLPLLGSAAKTIKLLWIERNYFYQLPNLKNFPKLHKAGISHNYISIVPEATLPQRRISVKLYGNPITCASELCWWTAHDDRSFKIFITCPAGVALSDVNPETLCEGIK